MGEGIDHVLPLRLAMSEKRTGAAVVEDGEAVVVDVGFPDAGAAGAAGEGLAFGLRKEDFEVGAAEQLGAAAG